MFKDNLVKAVHKSNSPTDWNNCLYGVWVEDKDRPSIYSKEKVLQDWNHRVVEHRA